MSTNNSSLFKIKNICVSVEDKRIVKGVSLSINAGEKHAVMGPNGSGKSTLTNALMGHPHYEITEGTIYINGEDITRLAPDERAKKGLFLGMQYPVAIHGVTVANFLRTALKALPDGEKRLKNMRNKLKETFKMLKIDQSFATRFVNDGFSGGEKKRLEILQLAMLKPKVALLDETDSGLDIDALQVVADGINRFCDENVAVLMVTHYQRMLKYVQPTYVHVFMDGRIVRSGGPELAVEIEKHGYEWLEKEVSQEMETV